MKIFNLKPLNIALVLGVAAFVSQGAYAADLTLVQSTNATSVQNTAQTPTIFYASGTAAQHLAGAFDTRTVPNVLPNNFTAVATIAVNDIVAALGGSTMFNIALDTATINNTANAQVLNNFTVQISGGGPFYGCPTCLNVLEFPTENPGNGWSDFILNGPVNLAGFAGRMVTFSWTQTWNDGNDEAFLVNAVPIPAALWFVGPALVGLLGLGRKKTVHAPEIFSA
jgi:hypothetical protein